MPNPKTFRRILLIVLDGAGIGAMSDAPEWGDAGSDTFGHILESRQVRLPNLQRYGLGNIRPLQSLPPVANPEGSYGRCALRSNGKDTTTGHWEMAGIILEQAFPTYPNGFPSSIIDRFVKETSVPGILGNIPASGTEIIKVFGEEHVNTQKPIVYTSADSVFQIAGIGKIASIYDSLGVTKDLTAKNNEQSIDQTINALRDESNGLIFSNLVDFDMLYGHRRDTEGYAKALEHFDVRLPEIESGMRDDDLMIITADHGNDPTFPGSDHTREYAPLLVYGKCANANVNLGTRASLADIGQTVAENFELKLLAGESFLRKLTPQDSSTRQ